MEISATVLMSDSFLCRLCGDENKNSTNLFFIDENKQDLSQLINRYLPLKVKYDIKLPSKICPGCNIQLQSTKLFLDLIVDGQTKLRNLYKIQQEQLIKEEKQKLQLNEALNNINTYTIHTDVTGEQFLIQIFDAQSPLFAPEHELSLRTEGLEKPKRKRGRPPKPVVRPESKEKVENVINENEIEEKPSDETDTDGNKRRRRVPVRYQEAVQGKELDKIFRQEGVTDEESGSDLENDHLGSGEKSSSHVIGRTENARGEDLGQPVVLVHAPRIRTKYRRMQGKKVKKYKCNICRREFTHCGRYEMHKSCHTPNYMCSEANCEFKTLNKDELTEHQEKTGHALHTVVENVNKIDTAQQSNTNDSEKTETSTETEHSSKEQKFYCEKCDRNFTCKQNYEVHVKAIHDGEKPFVCTSCNKSFSYSNALRIHRLKHRDEPDNEESKNSYPCPICHKLFRHPSSLQYHRDTKHANGRRFVCNKCDKPFTHRQLLQRHQLVHTDERPHRCSQCLAAFKTRANLINHTRSVHAGQRLHRCSQCTQTFAHKTSLMLHQRWHNGVRPYECDFCNKAFSQKGNLLEHRRIHTGEKPYHCDICDKSFTTSSQFKIHRKRHTGEKPHKCEYCSKTFLHKDTWKSHVRRHTNERPFSCKFCSKSFSEPWSLKKHERLHTGEKPYSCEVCSKEFADNSNLSKHRRIHDKEIVLVNTQKPEFEYLAENEADPTNIGVESITEETSDIVQLQQLIDQDGNPISLTTQDGQQIKVIASIQDGQEKIQGLLADGTLVPIDLGIQDKNNQLEDTIQKFNEDQLSSQLLDTNIQFLSDNNKIDSNIQFITDTDDSQGMCLVTTYNMDDTINPQYLTMS